ncbi:MAG TPA: toxin glutamine deamidase domain-containing protein, partial [Pilimelia sp.]|nr:toxin glutamine deamidase domain-containing protein [Pilimelia sp.]
MPASRPGATPPGSQPPGTTPPGPSPHLQAELERLERSGYQQYAAQQRAEHEANRRQDQAGHLRRVAENHLARARDLLARAAEARQAGFTVRADHLIDEANRETLEAYARQDEAEAVLAGQQLPTRVDVDPGRDFERVNDDVGNLAAGPVETSTRSALTGMDHPPSVDTTRNYGQRGGSRPPLALHQRDLERAMPRDANGDVVRTADPRLGAYFGLANDGGPAADPTRAINCQDCVLSFFDTWVHGRPRVAAPRTFDAYAEGDPNRPMDGEADGPGRVEDMTGGRFQALCPDVSHVAPAQAQQHVYHAFSNLEAQLHQGGHGSFAFIITAWEGGSAHAWAAINQNGTILYVDPQSGFISDGIPLYGHHGVANDGNVIMMDALVTDGQGNPMPLPNHSTGAWSARPAPAPAPTPTPSPTPAPSPAPGPVVTGDLSSLAPVPQPDANVQVAPEPGSAVPDAPDSDPAAGPAPDTHPQPAADTPVSPEPATQEDAAPAAGVQETEAQAAERQILESLAPEHRAALEASIDESQAVADGVLDDLQSIVDSLGGFDGDDRPQIVDEEYRVKTPESLARTFAPIFQTYGTQPADFLTEVDDRVRFSIQTPEQGYADTITAVLDQLRDRGYDVDPERDIKNFWRPGNRYNGVNVTARTPDGFTIEIQFPTEASRALGKQTHDLYKRVRLESAPPSERVEAFLTILELNQAAGIAGRMPEGLEQLPEAVNTSLTRWTERYRVAWANYQQSLAMQGRTFADVLAARGLGIEDFPGGERLGLASDDRELRLLGGVQEGSDVGAEQPDRGVGGGHHSAPGGVVERSAEGVDLRAGPGGGDDLRRPASGRGAAGGPADGGTDRPREPRAGASERGGTAPDVRGGRPAGLDLGATDVGLAGGAPSVATSPADLPNGERSGLADEETLRLPRGVQAGIDVGAEQPDRVVGGGPQPAPRGDVERSPEGVDLRAGAGGGADLRRPVSGRGAAGGPADGGADRPGEPGAGASERGGTEPDLRGGRPARLDLGATEVELAGGAPGADTSPADPVQMRPPSVESRPDHRSQDGPTPPPTGAPPPSGPPPAWPPSSSEGAGSTPATPETATADPAQLAAAQQAIADRITPHSPELAGVVSRLLTDHDNHPLGLTGALLDPARRDRTVDLLVQLAQGTALAPYGGDLQAFLQDNPAAGPLFEPVADEANVDDAGESRKQAAVEAGAEADLARAVGGDPTPEQQRLVEDYARRLEERVLPAVQAEIDRLAARVSADLGVEVHTSGRAKRAVDLLNKVFRMMAGRPGAPGRPDATVGDVIDAVGVRMTLPDMASLEAALDIVTAHFGVGDGGRIV